MHLSIVAQVGLDGRRPPQLPNHTRGVLKMLLERIVVLFPASERLVAEKHSTLSGLPSDGSNKKPLLARLTVRVSPSHITTTRALAHIGTEEAIHDCPGPLPRCTRAGGRAWPQDTRITHVALC